MSEVRSDSELVDAIPKPTGLGTVSLSSFRFSLPLIRLPLKVRHIHFAAAAHLLRSARQVGKSS
jgi:hypothetical protein